MGKNDNISALVERVYSLDIYGFNDSADTDALTELTDKLSTYSGAIDCIKYLLDYIDSQEG